MKLRMYAKVIFTVCTCTVLSSIGFAAPSFGSLIPPPREKESKQEILVFPANQYAAQTISELQSDPTLTSRYLQTAPRDNAPSQLVIKDYSTANGLVVGYTSQTGKRILFRGKYLPNGGATIQILHYDPVTGRLEHVVGRSQRLDEQQKAVKDVSVAGVDMGAFLRSGRTKSNGFAEKQQELKTFAVSDAGRALLEGVPALLAALEFQDIEPEVKKLIGPLGLVGMGLQMATGEFQGSRSIDKVLAPNQASALRQNCVGQADCTFRGNGFTITPSGFLDLLTKRPEVKTGIASIMNLAKSTVTSELGRRMALSFGGSALRPKLMDGDGTCSLETRQQPWFGFCGYGSMVLFGVTTPECEGHDLCVCAWGHGACLVDVAAHCTNAPTDACFSLWDATASFFESIWNNFWDWVISWFDDPPPEPCPPGEYCPGGGG